MSEEKKILVSARVSEAQANELDKIASKNGMNRSDVISAKLSDNFTKVKNQRYRNYLSQMNDICSNLSKLGESWVVEMDGKEDSIRLDFKSQLDELQQKVDDLTKENQTLKDTNTELNKSYEQFKKDTEAQRMTIATNQKLIDTLEAQKCEYKEQIKDYKSKYSDLQKKYETDAEVQTELMIEKNTNESLKADKEKLEAKVKELEDKLYKALFASGQASKKG